MICNLFFIYKGKILAPQERNLLLSSKDTIQMVNRPIEEFQKNDYMSPSKLKRILSESKPKHKKKAKKHFERVERQLYQKYDPKKYAKRYNTYKKHIEAAKNHILGQKIDPFNPVQREAKKKMEEKILGSHMKEKPSSFRVNMNEFRKKQQMLKHQKEMKQQHKNNYKNKKVMQRHLSKVVSDDAEDINELHTNEADEGASKLESIPLLLVGNYEIIIEKK